MQYSTVSAAPSGTTSWLSCEMWLVEALGCNIAPAYKLRSKRRPLALADVKISLEAVLRRLAAAPSGDMAGARRRYEEALALDPAYAQSLHQMKPIPVGTYLRERFAAVPVDLDDGERCWL
jgi:hypothetical protein